MVQDSAGFQSQQFGEQVAQRRDRYAAQNIDTWGQAANVVPRFQQAQQMVDERQIRAAKVASDLANDQLHRQQGLEDLQWAQQLHQTDMIGLQKRGMAAAIALQEAQARKAIDDLGGGERVPASMVFTPERMDYAISELGIMADPSNGLRTRGATAEERAAAAARSKARLQQDQQFELEQIDRRNQGRNSPPESLEIQRAMGIAKDRINFLLTELEHMQVPQRGSSDEERDAYATKRASIEKEVQELSREASQLGRTQQDGAVQQQPEMTVDDYLSRQSADALKILYPDGK